MSRQDEDNFEFLLSRHLDGQLGPSQQEKLRLRLAQDPELAEDLRQFQSLEAHLANIGVQELAELDYDAQRAAIMSSLERKVLLQGPRRRVLVLRPAFWGAMAAAAAVVLVGAFAWKSVFPPQPPGPDLSQLAVVKVLPVAPQVSGQAVIRVSSQRLAPEDVVPAPKPPRPAGRAPSGTVMVSIMPPDGGADRNDQGGPMAGFEFPI